MLSNYYFQMREQILLQKETMLFRWHLTKVIIKLSNIFWLMKEFKLLAIVVKRFKELRFMGMQRLFDYYFNGIQKENSLLGYSMPSYHI